MMKSAITCIILLMGSLQAFAANHYVRSAASGTATGADWTNACTDFTGSCAVASLVRGDTYYVGTGTYAGRTFNTADSSTSIITIKGATVADHGTVTGWSNAFSVSSADGGSQALWSGTLTFRSDYWVWDGTVGAGTTVNPADITPTDYGFRWSDGLTLALIVGSTGSSGVCGTPAHDITWSHFYSKASTSDTHKEFMEGSSFGGVLTNLTWSNFVIDTWQGVFRTTAGACSFTAETGLAIQYGVILNPFSSATNHGEVIDPDERSIDGLIFRFNIVRGTSGSGGATGTIVANNANNSNAQIYGNVFDSLVVGNGVITGTSSGNLNNAVVYNNVFLNITLIDCGHSAVGGTGQGTGNAALNNVFYNMLGCFGAGFTHDYDAFFSTTSTATETNRQTGASNPFTNSASFDYSLLTDTTAGNTLSSPFDVDALGVTRGANGTWDRGALQIAGSTPTITPAPSSGMFAELVP